MQSEQYRIFLIRDDHKKYIFSKNHQKVQNPNTKTTEKNKNCIELLRTVHGEARFTSKDKH